MAKLFSIIFVSTFIISFNFVTVCSNCTPDTKHGHVNDTAEVTALQRISKLQGAIWEWETYAIGICPIEVNKHKDAGAVIKNVKGDVILGTTNVTHATSGAQWVLLSYRGGNASNTTCIGNNSADILLLCDLAQSQQGIARFVEQDGCVTRFEVATSLLCIAEGPSTFSLIFVWSVFLFTLYCLLGIVYRRFRLSMRGRQQLPHLPFWSKIGRGCADCCNWACRCDDDTPETWDADTDRDDVLLRP